MAPHPPLVVVIGTTTENLFRGVLLSLHNVCSMRAHGIVILYTEQKRFIRFAVVCGPTRNPYPGMEPIRLRLQLDPTGRSIQNTAAPLAPLFSQSLLPREHPVVRKLLWPCARAMLFTLNY